MSKENKKIPMKNYIILGAIVLLTIFAVFYARNLYIMSKEYYNNNSVMLDVVKEVQQDELSNYLIENPKFVLYVSSGQNKDIKAFEKNFKSIITKTEIEDNILYLNSDNTDMPKLKQSLQKIATTKAKDKIDTNSAVTMYIIENGQVTNTIINAEKLSKGQVKTLLKKYEVTDND